MPLLWRFYVYLWTFERIAAFTSFEDSHVPRLEVLILVFTYPNYNCQALSSLNI